MAPEVAAEGYYMAPCCGESDAHEPHGYYDGQDDKRAMNSGHCGGSQYHSWPAPANFAGYPSNEAKSYAPPPYAMPPHGVPLMPVHVPSLHFGHSAAGQMVPPQPPLSALPTPRTTPRGRVDITDTSSSNCTPRDHYSAAMDRHSPLKRHSRKPEAGHRFPVVKIPEGLKKQQGQPSPAPWLNSRGFPLRMGKPACKHYTSKGWCAYGTLCKFNHPEDMPAAVPYPMMTCLPGSQPMVMTAPWMGMSYPWNGTWSQQHQPAPVHHGYPYTCHPCSAGPCSTDSGHSYHTSTERRENEQATDSESTALYH